VPSPAAVGIDVGGTKLVAATVAADGTVLERQRRRTPASDAASLVTTLTELITELGPHLPVGIGIAGLVTPDGIVRYGPNIGVRDLPLAAELERATGATIRIVNDASAAALGEQRAGGGRGREHVVLLTLGTGVGGGIVVGGELVLGREGFAGEVGHVLVVEGGRPCPCGNHGCIEAYASGTAIGLLARERLVDLSVASSLREVPDLSGREVTDAAVAGDAFAQELLGTVGHWLGVALASLVNALDPEVVLIGGGAAAPTAPWVLPAAAASLRERLVGSPWREPPELRLAELGDDAGMVGAGLYALQAAGHD
jgi:glucokinase